MSQDAKPLGAEELSATPLSTEEIEQWRSDERAVVQPSRHTFRVLATIDRLNDQLATARDVIAAMGDEDWQAVVAGCGACGEAAQIEQDPSFHCERHDHLFAALAAIDKGADGAEPSWEDAAMKGQSNVAFKAVVESANNALIAFDRFIEERHDGVDFVYEQIGGPMEELRGVLHGAETESEERR